MNISETSIATAGVFRCCLAHFQELAAGNFSKLDFKVGDTFKCQHCHDTFKLQANKRWIPTPQIKG